MIARGSLRCAPLLVVAWLGGCGHHDEDRAAAEPHAEEEPKDAAPAGTDHAAELHVEDKAALACGITTEKVSRRTIRKSFRVAARTVADPEASAHVGTSIAGRVRELRARIGDEVKTGAVLAILDSVDLGQAETEYLRERDASRIAQIPLEPLKSSYERAKALLESSGGRSITLAEVQRREIDLRAAEAELARAESGARAAERRLQVLGLSKDAVERLATSGDIDTAVELKSPVDGTVTEREATLGEFVAAGGERLFVVTDTSRLWVMADLPEAHLADVVLKQPVRVEFPAVGVAGEGAILLFGAEVSAVTRTLPMRIAIQSPDDRLRPGLLADVEIAVGNATETESELLAVPQDAVQTVGGRPVVFAAVKDEPFTFVARPVTLGPAANGFVAILGGLAEGDDVVTHGAFYLKADLGKSAAADED